MDFKRQEYTVTLVHGTFARKAKWVRGDSEFCKRLGTSHAGEMSFHPFFWSGRNGHRARMKASKALRTHLNQVIELKPNAKHYIVGHSHGGNVILSALHDENLRNKVSGIVCLSTPFLIARPRNLGNVPHSIFLAAIVSWLVGFGILLIYMGFWIPYIDRLPSFVREAVYYMLLVPLILAFHSIAEWWKDKASRVAQEMAMPELAPHKLLIIRGTGDEASGLLSAAHFFSWTMTRLWARFANISSFFVKILTHVKTRLETYDEDNPRAFFATIIVGFPTLAILTWAILDKVGYSIDLGYFVIASFVLLALFKGFYENYWRLLLAVCVFPVAFFLLPLFMFLVTMGVIPYGPTLALIHPLLEIAVEPTPPGDWRLCQFSDFRTNSLLIDDWKSIYEPMSSKGLTLEHSSTYKSEQIIKIISGWMFQGHDAA